ncbi:MAG: hypothetical protein CFE45_06890 [Burkholderiales bacterium PBB5]|nr:MAG: hypothetical protein CFE45_06890 [Burkholderiales bacterium PBB5]
MNNNDSSGTGRRRWMGSALALGVGSVAGLPGCALGPRANEPEDSTEHPMVLPFSTGASGDMPDGWRPYALRRDLAQTRYSLVSDGNRQVLHARARSAATGLRCAVRIDPQRHPLLNFSWRVPRVPAQATVDTPERDDSPARVIVAFDGDMARLPLRDRLFFDQVELFTGQKLPFAMLMYTWCAALPTETVVANHRTRRIQYLTVESGDQHVGRWRHYQRDVQADYRRAFGEAPGDIISVGVLTDSDALKTDLEAWYGDIVLAPRAPA